MQPKALQSLLLLTLIFLTTITTTTIALPLSTSGRYLVDYKTGHRVKLTCGNWPGHLSAMVQEGLDKRPLRDIVSDISALKFNCVRLTYATYMFTRTKYSSMTVSESFKSLNLTQALAGISVMNPGLVNLTLPETYEAVADELGRQGLMVVADNHVSKPKWCCANDDGNGFFGDRFFNPAEWLRGLTRVAKRFLHKSHVIGMSMRNELRGKNQTIPGWFKWVKKGAKRIHHTNPNVLVIISGLDFDTNLTFLKTRSLDSTFNHKLVYEAHWYSWGGELHKWQVEPLNKICAKSISDFKNHATFVNSLESPFPLFVSEFGIDQTGKNIDDNRYLSCFLSFAEEQDVDSALWALQGSYYLREGLKNTGEVFGTLDFNWNPRHSRFDDQRQLMYKMIRDVKDTEKPYSILYHPASGHCVQQSPTNTIHTNNCESWIKWDYEGNGSPIKLRGTSLCLQVVADGFPPILSKNCSSNTSAWNIVSTAELQVSSIDEHGNRLCLEKGHDDGIILTNKCLCLENEDTCYEDTQPQWFKFVTANVK